MKTAPPVGAVLGPELAPVGQGDLAGDRQAQPGSLGLGREEWLEQVRQDLGREARSVVGHARRDGAAGRVEAGRQPERRRLAAWPGRRWSSGCGRPAPRPAGPSRPGADRARGRARRGSPARSARSAARRAASASHGVEVARGEILGVGPRELQAAARRSPRADRPRRSGRRSDSSSRPSPRRQSWVIAADAGQRVADLVGDAGEQLPQRRQPLAAPQLGLEPLALGRLAADRPRQARRSGRARGRSRPGPGPRTSR